MNYTFFTIHTVIDIGSGEKLDNIFELSPKTNLKRVLDYVTPYGYPMMVSVTKTVVDLEKKENQKFYSLPKCWGECVVHTLKFSISGNITSFELQGIPLAFPTIVNSIRISKFDSICKNNNTSIRTQTF